MKSWTYYSPVRVHFGEGQFNTLPDLLRGRSYVLITYPDAPFPALAKRIEELVGAPLLTIDTVEPNPSTVLLEQMAARLHALPRAPEVLLALGGGSVIDSAKVLAAGKDAWSALLRGAPVAPAAPLPLIAIPTTSGTGSEVTCWATVWDQDNGRKLSLSHESLYPREVIVDPELMAELPWGITLSSGLDALSHALESLWNIHASPVTRDLAVLAARELMHALPALSRSLDDPAARRSMALGSLRAGLAFSNTRTALAHNISYPITLRHGLAHGVACSFCLPDVMTAAVGADPECDAALVAIFGDLAGAAQRLRDFLQSLGVATDAAAHGIDANDWRELVAQAFVGERGRNFIGSLERFPFPDGRPADIATCASHA